MNLTDFLLMKNGNTVKPGADLFDILLAKKLGGAGVITTLVGNPLSFLAKKAQTAKSTKVTLSPVQEGSGDPSPTNIRPISGRSSVEINGCGATVWNGFYEDGNILSDGSDGTSNSYQRTGYIKVKGNVSYYLVCNDIYKRIYWYDINKNFISSNILTAAVKTSPSNAVYARSMFQKTTDPNPNESCSLNYPSTDTSYHAYQQSNDVTVTFPALGKNLFDKDTCVFVSEKYIKDDGSIGDNSGYCYCETYISVKSSTNYVFSGVMSSTATVYNSVAFYDSNKEFISRFLPPTPGTGAVFTTPVNCAYIRFNTQNYSYVDIFQLEEGSTATSYEPYTNTVYGGTLDMEKGELAVDRGIRDLGTLNWTKSATNKFSSNVIQDAKLFSNTQKTTAISSEYVAVAASYIGNVDFAFCFGLNETKVIMINDSTKYNLTAQEFTAEVSGVQLVYELATPRTIQLTPEQIQIIKGQNNIWIEDEGAVMELTYRA